MNTVMLAAEGGTQVAKAGSSYRRYERCVYSVRYYRVPDHRSAYPAVLPGGISGARGHRHLPPSDERCSRLIG